MDTLLQAVIIVFLLFLCALCLFAVVVIVRDIIRESSQNRREKDEPAPEAQTTPTPVVEAEVAVAEPEKAEDENAVVFSKYNPTMSEKYAALSTEYKRYFDEIARYALSKEEVKEFRYNSSYDYKDGSYRVLRMTIKRGEIICEFTFINRDFLNYANASNVKMKQSATTVKVLDASAVGVAKDGIDLACTQIAEDREYKKNLAKEKRRERARQKAAEAESTPSENTEDKN